MRRKEGRGGRRDEESEKMKKLLKKTTKSLKDASLASLVSKGKHNLSPSSPRFFSMAFDEFSFLLTDEFVVDCK